MNVPMCTFDIQRKVYLFSVSVILFPALVSQNRKRQSCQKIATNQSQFNTESHVKTEASHAKILWNGSDMRDQRYSAYTMSKF